MGKFQINDIELYYEIHGTGEPVIFIHGLGSSTEDWQLQCDAFASDYQVILFDCRGHGQSSKPQAAFSISQLADDLDQLIRGLNLPACHLVGLSMGAMIAVQCALDYPASVKSVVALNTPPSMKPTTLATHLAVLKRKVLVLLFSMEKIGQVIAGKLFPGDEHEATRLAFAKRWARNDPANYRNAFNAIIAWDVTDRLPEFKPPLLVMAAREDYTSLESKQVFIEKVEGARLVVIEDSRHATPVEKPEVFNGLLRSWLEETSATT